MEHPPSYEASEFAASSSGPANGPVKAPPYDEEQCLRTSDQSKRKRVRGLNRMTSRRDTRRASNLTPRGTSSPETGRRPSSQSIPSKILDKLTNTTHEERAERRKSIADQERKIVQMHDAIQRAWKTGRPEFARRDSNGKDIYALPPGDSIIKDDAVANHEAFANSRAVFITPKNLTPNPTQNGYAGPHSRPIGYGSGAALGSIGMSGGL